MHITKTKHLHREGTIPARHQQNTCMHKTKHQQSECQSYRPTYSGSHVCNKMSKITVNRQTQRAHPQGRIQIHGLREGTVHHITRPDCHFWVEHRPERLGTLVAERPRSLGLYPIYPGCSVASLACWFLRSLPLTPELSSLTPVRMATMSSARSPSFLAMDITIHAHNTKHRHLLRGGIGRPRPGINNKHTLYTPTPTRRFRPADGKGVAFLTADRSPLPIMFTY